MSSTSEESISAGRRTRPIDNLWFPAGIMFLCFAIVAVCAVQRQYGLGMPTPQSTLLTLGGFLDWLGRLLGISHLSRQSLTVVYMTTVVVMFAAYAWALIVLARRGNWHAGRTFIIGTSVAFCLWILFVPPILAQDLFNYVSYGRALSVYGKNPYIATPRAFPTEPVLRYIGWKGTPSVYGPLFNYMAALAGLGGKGAVENTIVFKLMTFVFFVASLFVIDDLARRLRPDRRDFILLAAAWNPLVIIHLVGGGHNDTIMIFFVVTGFLLYHKGYPILAMGSVVLASMIKSTALFVLIPMVVLFLRQNARWTLRKYVEAAAVLIGVPLALYVPTWPGLKGFKLVLSVGSGYSDISIPRFFRGQLSAALRGMGLASSTAGTVSMSTVRVFFMLVFIVLFVFFCYRVRDLPSLIFYAGIIIFTFTLTTTWLMPWYAGFQLVLLALTGSYRWTVAGVGLTLIMSLYGHGINGWTNSIFPVLMVLVVLALVAGSLLGSRQRTVAESPA